MFRLAVIVCGFVCFLHTPFSFAQSNGSPVTLTPTVQTVDVPVSAATVYRGRASVTREMILNLQPGSYDLQFIHLPETVLTDSLQARSSIGVKILNVEYEEIYIGETASPQIAELDHQIEDLEDQIKALERNIGLNELKEKFIDRVSIRASNDAGDKGGTDALDLQMVRQQYAFLTEEWEIIINEHFDLESRKAIVEQQMKVLQAERNALAGSSKTDRVATVSAVVLSAGEATVDLTYLVHNATWQPKYNIRAEPDGGSITIEYDAVLTQRTGENWDNVALTLSTARPTVAANPPTLTPWYVDVATEAFDGSATAAPMRRKAIAKGRDGVVYSYSISADKAAEKNKMLEWAAGEAEVAGEGPSVTFSLPRLVTVETNAKKQQRTRITTIKATPEFVHIAVPLLTDAVYVLARFQNTGAYQLLPGAASVFAGQDYIGPTTLPAVAPNGDIKVFFGIDESVKATRTLVNKSTGKTGLLGGGRRTSFNYRIEIDNGTGKDIAMEIWDRQPVSRNEKIVINLVKPTHSLATDKEYTEKQKPQGLLKWVLSIPSRATANTVFTLTYGIDVDRPKEIKMTQLPE